MPNPLPVLPSLLCALAWLLLLVSCSGDDSQSCLSCHRASAEALSFDHQLECTACHNGNPRSKKKKKAHKGLISTPAAPDQMEQHCGSCHKAEVQGLRTSIHYTLAPATNLFREAFNAPGKVKSFTEVQPHSEPADALQLADDLLRRRCFRCHLYSAGDEYSAVRHGVGCAACHMPFADGAPESHHFQLPTDRQCLSCHYGNTVGADYYGRFERDYSEEYRTPYWPGGETADARPWGVEFLQLAPDIHKERGLQCIDCHSGNELMKGGTPLTCRSCHDSSWLATSLPPGATRTAEDYSFTDHSGKTHPLPQMSHPAHQKPGVDCQVCHAQWGFNDMQKFYLRSDTDNYDRFLKLAVQGSSEVEHLVINNSDFDNEELPMEMTDTLSGRKMPGVWFKGFLQRRHELQLGRRDDGTITTVRPLLDVQLSWIDADDKVRMDAVESQPSGGIYRPCTPHTTGHAGIFYEERIRQFERSEKEAVQGRDLWIKARPASKKALQIAR